MMSTMSRLSGELVGVQSSDHAATDVQLNEEIDRWIAAMDVPTEPARRSVVPE
jgi:hypothetical protein